MNAQQYTLAFLVLFSWLELNGNEARQDETRRGQTRQVKWCIDWNHSHRALYDVPFLISFRQCARHFGKGNCEKKLKCVNCVDSEKKNWKNLPDKEVHNWWETKCTEEHNNYIKNWCNFFVSARLTNYFPRIGFYCCCLCCILLLASSSSPSTLLFLSFCLH